MGCYRFVALLVAVSFVASRGWAQSPSDEARQLRQQLEQIQEKLKAWESKSVPKKRRVTELSTPRPRPEEPEIVVRLYDLSDLFTVAPPYPAYSLSDFSAAGLPGVSGGPSLGVPLFPSTVDTGSSPTGYGAVGMGGMGMGGMGAMGMGGMSRQGGAGNPHGGGGLFDVQDTPQSNRPRGSLGQPGQPSEGISAARTSIDELINAITSTISPEQWDAVGGPASIAPMGTSLLISATEPMHEQISKLFDTFRQRWGTHRTVSVDAHWLWLTESELGPLLSPAINRGAAGEVRAFGLVNDAAWEKMAKNLPPKAEERPAGYHATITCYNGQTVHIFSGGQKHFVITMIPVVGDQGEGPAVPGTPPAGPGSAVQPAPPATPRDVAPGVGYQPVVASVQEGAALQVTPMATVKGKFVVLDIHSRVVHVEERQPAARPVAQRPSTAMGSLIRDIADSVDRPVMVNHHLETTLRVPVDRRMLVGGMTFDSQPKAGEPGLYLFVKVSIQDLRDDMPDTKMNVIMQHKRAKRGAKKPR